MLSLNLFIATLQPVEKMVKHGNEKFPYEQITFRAMKGVVIMVMFGLVICLLVAHPASAVLELAETCLPSLVLTFMVQLRKHCLEKHGFVVEENENVATDSSHGNPQDVEHQYAHESPQEKEERDPLLRRRMKK
ncbi:predicted protein [Chaetoceros tenuissimus]|uniref:Uncharacterized protein n=1 Tax=Chaetoceros tenuissimus TaxID=426638 RepID=A0AAD3H121_9STRA|nr:predicted protein [Chaetoceros tenuissimus]